MLQGATFKYNINIYIYIYITQNSEFRTQNFIEHNSEDLNTDIKYMLQKL